MTVPRWARLSARSAVLLYLAVLLLVPVGLVFYRTFEPGLGAVWDSISTPDAEHAFWLTIKIAAIAVPLNTVFGVLLALLLARRRFPGKALINAIVDLPFAISPVVIGLSLLLVYGVNEPIGGWLSDHGIRVIFAMPGMVLATIFVCIPFVVREVVPVLREVGTDQEEAAATLGASGMQTFWRITLPAIRWGVIYGVILTTARAIGEYGAVAVVSGQISGNTETLTLFVKQQYDQLGTDARVGAYGASVVLILLAIIVVVLMNLLNRKGSGRGYHGV